MSNPYRKLLKRDCPAAPTPPHNTHAHAREKDEHSLAAHTHQPQVLRNEPTCEQVLGRLQRGCYQRSCPSRSLHLLCSLYFLYYFLYTSPALLSRCFLYASPALLSRCFLCSPYPLYSLCPLYSLNPSPSSGFRLSSHSSYPILHLKKTCES